MAIRFTSEFRSDTGIDYKIEIDDSLFVGSPSTFKVAAEGFVLEYAGETDDIVSPIMSSNVSIPFMVETVLQETFFEQLVSVQESRFRLKISRFDSGSYKTYWTGYIMQDIAQVEDVSFPYIYDLRAVDGLGRLANIDYNINNDIFQNSLALTRLNKILYNCLSSIGTTDLFGSGEAFLETCVNWWENSMVYSTTKDAANEIAVDRRIFTTIDDEGVEIYTKMIDVLRQLCVTFGSRVYQSNGRFIFEQYSERAAATRIVSTYNRSGNYIATTSKSDDVVINKTPGAARMAGNQFDFLPAIKRCEIEFQQKFMGSRVGQILFSHNRTAAQVFGFISADANASLQINCPSIRYYVTNGAPPPPSVPFNSIVPIFGLMIRIEDVNNPGVYWYYSRAFNGYNTPTPYGPASWTTTASDYMFDPGNSKFNQNGDVAILSTINIQTDQLPVSGELVFQLKQPVLRRVFNNSLLSAPPLYNGLPINSVITYNYFANVDYVSDGKLNPQSVIYRASNNNTQIESNLVLSLGFTSVADGPLQTGNLAVYTGSAWVGSDQWRKGNSGSYKKILQLVVTEALGLHAKPIRRYNGSFFFSQDISRRFTFNLYDWLFIGGRFTANIENVDGEFFAIARDVSDVVDLNNDFIDGELEPTSANKYNGPNSFGGVFTDGSIGGMLVDSDTTSVGPFSEPTAGTARITGTTTIDGDANFTQDVEVTGDLIVDGTIVIDGLGDVATEQWVIDQGYLTDAVTSVALTAPAAFSVTGSPITSAGTIAISGAGTSAQYIRGDGSLQTFPSLTGFVPYVGATANVNLGTHTLLSKDIVINHPSGSGIAASITKNGSGAAVSIIKDGSGEGLTVVKGSGSGNAASITGGVTLISELHLTTSLADSYISSSGNWNAAFNDKINSAAVTGTTTKTLTLTQQDGGTITASWTDINTDAVTSVFGRTGAVVATSGDYTTAQVTESGNLYYTEARVNANTNVAANTAARHNAVTIGTANGLSLSTQVLSLGLASASANGALSSADWTTFNSKQNALTNPVTGTGTTNYVSKFTGANTVGNSQIFDNATNVGIGTATPSRKLDVDGAIRTRSSTIDFGNGTDTQIWGDGTNLNLKTNGSERIVITSTGNVGIGTTSPTRTLHVVGGDSGSGTHIAHLEGRFGVVGMYVRGDGNVGIGTTSPAHKLSVVGQGTGIAHIGDAGFGSTNYVGASFNGTLSTTNYNILSSPTDPHLYINRPAGNEIRFREANVEQMRILAGGNVGIGTTSPLAQLHVANTMRIGVGFGDEAVSIFGDSGTPYWRIGRPASSGNFRISSYAVNALEIQPTTGNVGIGTTSPAYKLVIAGASHSFNVGPSGGGIDLYSTGNIAPHYQTTFDWYSGVPGSGTFRMGLTSAGNLGIGTTSPAARLDVAGDLRTYNGITSRGDHSYTFIENLFPAANNGAGTGDVQLRMWCSEPGVTWDWAGFGYNVRNDNGSPNGFGRVNTAFGQSYMRFDTTGNLYFYNTNTSGTRTTTMTLSSAGNVGIGTTSPATPLHVAAVAAVAPVIRLQTTNSTTNGAIQWTNSANSQLVLIGSNYNVSDGSGNLEFVTGGSSTRMLITSGGNVGVGTTSPGYKLEVSGDIYTSGDILAGATNAAGWHRISIATGGLIAQNGSKGIGAYQDASFAEFFSYDYTSSSYQPLSFRTSTLNIANNGGSSVIYHNGTNVGIGTTSPATKLHVEGRIYAGDIGISTTSPTQKLHVVGNARITGWIFDSLNLQGNPGDVLTSTSTGMEWLPGGGGGGGSTIIVKDEGTTIGSSFTTLDFVGDNIQASASGSTAVITTFNNAGTGSIFANASTSNFAPGSTWSDIEIDGSILILASAPDAATGSSKLIATVTFGVENVSLYDNFNNFEFRLYNVNSSLPITDTTHTWTGYMSKDEGATRTVFTFHIPLDRDVTPGDEIRVQVQQGVSYTPEIYFCSMTLMEGTY
jgi:hypothetical protein